MIESTLTTLVTITSIGVAVAFIALLASAIKRTAPGNRRTSDKARVDIYRRRLDSYHSAYMRVASKRAKHDSIVNDYSIAAEPDSWNVDGDGDDDTQPINTDPETESFDALPAPKTLCILSGDPDGEKGYDGKKVEVSDNIAEYHLVGNLDLEKNGIWVHVYRRNAYFKTVFRYRSSHFTGIPEAPAPNPYFDEDGYRDFTEGLTAYQSHES